ncbi:MAG: hypothetical protein AB3N16_02630 [Flavobacteriaceae bacterium]
MDAKNQVLDYLKHNRSLMGGRNLYNQLPRKSLALQNSFRRMTDTEANRSRMHYEIARSVGITERELKIILQKPIVQVTKKVDEPTPPPTEPPSLEDRLLAFKADAAEYYPSKELAKELGLKPKKSKVDLFQQIEEAKQELIQKEIDTIPLEVKASVKLRDQFPFLRKADCPDVLKILVNELISAYERFKEVQPKLHELLSADVAKHTVDVVLENYIKNKEAWDELEHYKETGNLLGKHPVFERLAAKEEIAGLSTPDLTQKIKNLENNIGRNKNKGNEDLVARDQDLLAHAKAVLEKR